MNATDRERSLARFWAKVNKADSCWIWTGSTTQQGYGRLRRGGHIGRILLAHRFAYEATRGPIPADLVIDHLCRNILCVNPDHLEPVTDRENVRRGIGPTARNARKTSCRWGHRFTPENTGTTAKRNRYCLRCAANQSARWRQEHLESNRAYQREWARRKRALVRAALERRSA